MMNKISTSVVISALTLAAVIYVVYKMTATEKK